MNNIKKQLKDICPTIQLVVVELPEDHTLNDMLVNYGADSILKLLDEAKQFFDATSSIIESNSTEGQILPSVESKAEVDRFTIHHEHKFSLTGKDGTYYVLGQLPSDLGLMKVSLCFEHLSGKKLRTKLDLFEPMEVINFSKLIAGGEHVDIDQIQIELFQLADHLEDYRNEQLEQTHLPTTKRASVNLCAADERRAIEFLKQKNLITEIDKLIESSGVAGEISNRKMLFIIASTYKMPNQLHALVQGTSGSGKTHLINSIASLMPPEDTMNMTRVTSKSFYYYDKDELVGKLILIQDMDGLDEEAKLAFREMQSAGLVSSSTAVKDKYGNIHSVVKTVNASFASLVATTHAEIYYDNMSRSIVLGVDESIEQTQLIIREQNRRTAGLFDELKAKQSKELLQNCIRTLRPYQVVNPYADKIMLPVEAKMLRRLNNHYQAFVAQITLLHQYQREKDVQGRLIATIEDLELACEILFDAIMLKVDELDSSTRQFFEQVKAHVKKQSNLNYTFTQRDIRHVLNQSKSTCFRYMEDLLRLEYIQVSEGTANRGYRYRIAFWDDMEKTRHHIKQGLITQISSLKE